MVGGAVIFTPQKPDRPAWTVVVMVVPGTGSNGVVVALETMFPVGSIKSMRVASAPPGKLSKNPRHVN